MRTETGLHAIGLSKWFGREPNAVRALDDVTLEIVPASFVIVLGASGSGKSCLLAAMSGLQRPDRGEVHFQGRDIWARGHQSAAAFRRDACGFVFQSPGLFPSLTAWQQIYVPLRQLGVDRQDARLRASEALDHVGLGRREGAFPTQLSGGQNQRVAIARMLAKQPAILFCDEPTSALDTNNARQIGALLQHAVRQRGATIVCATHDERLIPFCDRVITLQAGCLIHDQPQGPA